MLNLTPPYYRAHDGAMNTTTAPRTLRQTIARTLGRNVLCGGLLVGSFATVAFLVPGEMTMVAPEHGAAKAAASTQAQRQYDRAMEKCEALPAGTLPGAAVIDWTGDRPTSYTEDPAEVDLAFQVALGETSPRIAGLNLCR